MKDLEKINNILKMRISSLIDEHAIALSQAQSLHQELDEAKKNISILEARLEAHVQENKEKPGVTIIEHNDVDSVQA